MTATYPALRLRRTRASEWSRRLHAETVLTPADLIWPLFVPGGEGVEQPVATLPGVARWSVDAIVARGREARDLGIPCVALFPHTPPALSAARSGCASSLTGIVPAARRSSTVRPQSIG